MRRPLRPSLLPLGLALATAPTVGCVDSFARSSEPATQLPDGGSATPDGGTTDAAPAVDGGSGSGDGGDLDGDGGDLDGGGGDLDGGGGDLDGGGGDLDGGTSCATPPTGDWAGTSRIQQNGGGSFVYVDATVSWTLATSEGCVDTFRPTGTAIRGFEGPEGTSSHPVAIGPGDGALVIDRSTAPASYAASGTTSEGERWVDHRGGFDGAMVGGQTIGQVLHRWTFARVDAVFTPPAGGCSEPPADRWFAATTYRPYRSLAEVTWTRTSTTGCVDRFEPSGTATILPGSTTSDAVLTYDPDAAAIGPLDGSLSIDRSTDPARFWLEGRSGWPAVLTYTYPDGSQQSNQGEAHTIWAENVSGSYDGDRFEATVGDGDDAVGWSFTRLE